VARAADVRLQVSHIVPRRGGPSDALERSIEVVERARADGVDIAFDAHTRLFGITNLNVVLPPWALEGGIQSIAARLADPAARAEMKRYNSLISSFGLGGWENVFVLDAPHTPETRERSIADLATGGKDPYDVMHDVLLAHVDEIHRPMCICWSYHEDQLALAFSHPLCMVGSDATTLSPDGPLGDTAFHGAYTWASWYFRRMVRERGLLSSHEAVHRLTALPADRMGMRDRGRVAPGMRADLAVLDPDGFRENGTVEDPNRLASGVIHVVINGQIALEGGHATGIRAGHVLRR
jgi:N-acyl-D-aspartate/D-glutamate deacylase